MPRLLPALLIGFIVLLVPFKSDAILLTSDLSIGSRGAEVTQLQLILFQFGYSTAAPNGVYSETTADGVRALQKKYGLAVTGTLDARTRALLNPFISRNPTSGATRPAAASSGIASGGTAALGLGSSGPAVLEVQQKLAALGYFKETPTGYFGPITRAAVITFQAAKGLEQVGQVGPLTRAALAGAGPVVASSGGTSSSSIGVTPAATQTKTTGERPPALTFRIDRKFALVGDYIYLNWSAKRADRCTASGGWSGEKGTRGTDSFAVAGDTTYTLTCTGSGGSVTKSVWVSTTLVARKAEEPEEIAETPVVTVPTTPTTPTTPATPTTPTTPKPTPILTTLPGPSKSYQVYAGCEAPAKSYARVIYVDPVNGTDAGDGSAAAPLKTASQALASKKIKPGDHVVLLPGNHGRLYADGVYGSAEFKDAANWTWLDFQEGAYISNLDFRNGMSRWLITNAEASNQFSTSARTMIATSGGIHFVFADGELYSIKNASSWSASDWLNKAASGISTRNTRCVSILDNDIRNVAGGITLQIDANVSDNSIKGLVARNTIFGNQADGLRPLGSDITMRDNRVIESMLGSEHGDGNHDDGLQIFPIGSHVFNNIRIEGNWIQESTASGRPLIGGQQGIGHFGGPLKNSVIRNNVILSSVWHGISTYDPENVIIEHNTVLNTSGNKRATWIAAWKGGKAENPTSGVIVRNNIAHSFILGNGVASSSNIVIAPDAPAFVQFDHVNGRFDLRPKPGGPLDGKNAGASGVSSGLGSQAASGNPYAQTAAAAQALPTLEQLYLQLQNLLNTLRN
ncbi:MAG TPA: peptidoglycan-binding protein [Candidatus Paceibacterota bacterium]|nr:peptidoglycan-binding protein [Candidatus Paceibacterota bacterium]